MKCIKCREIIPEGRLKAIPETKTCTSCSGARMKGVVTLMKGEGDHTWIETIHLDADDYDRYLAQEKKQNPPPQEEEQ